MSDGLPVSAPIQPSYAPVYISVYVPGLTDRSQPILSSACSADPADVELVSQHKYMKTNHVHTNAYLRIHFSSMYT